MSAPQSTQPIMPSDVVPATRSQSLPQQASTQPGDGSEIRVVDKQTRDQLVNDPNINVVELPSKKVPFKDQVVGYAHKTKGTVGLHGSS
ncbi:hypothetical protein ONZ45_g7189 [Pleurotus djamor]|nr:hypothetical protein ONZ45_g7189 [Pleurotus djamor]